MDVRSLFAAQNYAQSLPAMKPEPGAGQAVRETFDDAMQSFVDTVQRGEDTAKATMAGDTDPHALVEALAQSELAIETVVHMRNKVVEAYQEILRMPV